MNIRRRLERLATASFTDAECPPADQLADFALGALGGMEQLQVAAHLRGCPVCRDDVFAVRASSQPEVRLVGEPGGLEPLLGYRNRGEDLQVRQYRAAQLRVELTIGQREGDYRRVSGKIRRDKQDAPFASVTIRLMNRRRIQQLANEAGFFTFDLVPVGTHTITIRDGQVELTIDDLVLEGDEE